MGENSRRVVPVVLVMLALGVGLWLWSRGRDAAPPTDGETAARPAAPAAPPDAAGPASASAPTAAAGALAQAPVPAAEPPVAEEWEEVTGEFEGDDLDPSELVHEDPEANAAAWAEVDMEAVRRALPGNLYFELSAPTTDEAELERRRRERDRWNTEYGKILSGTGSEEEIRAFYDHRARLSTDYIEFATHLLDQYRDTLPERDVAMLELARKLNAARLEEIPRRVEEAYARKRQQDEARAAWLAGEAEFAGGNEGDDAP